MAVKSGEVSPGLCDDLEEWEGEVGGRLKREEMLSIQMAHSRCG